MKHTSRPRNEILSLFSSSPSSSFSMDEVAAALPDVGKSTVYRVVPILEKEGKVMRTAVEGRKGRFQYSDSSSCPRHFHIRCSVCGKTEHLDEDASREIGRVVALSSGYTASLSSVLEGLCCDCRMKGGK